jgi:hypothetical protein
MQGLTPGTLHDRVRRCDPYGILRVSVEDGLRGGLMKSEARSERERSSDEDEHSPHCHKEKVD